METIKLESSPAQLLATEDEGDEGEPVSIHEPADDDGEDDPEEAAAVPEELTPEEKETRRQLLRKIGRYKALFGKELTDITTTGLDKMPLAALQDLATDVEFLVGTRRSARAVRGLFLGGIQAVELAGPLIGFRLQGLANVAAASEDLLTTVDEVAVKYESQLYVDPVARLALGIMQLAVAVDSHNRRKDENSVTPMPAPPAANYEGPKPSSSNRPDNLVPAEYADL